MNASTPTVTVESLNETAANRKDDVRLKLDHIHASLDLLRVLSLSHDPDGDLNALCVGTLEAALDGLMREVAEVQAYVSAQPIGKEGES